MPSRGAALQGLYQKAIVIAVCVRIALDTVSSAGQLPLTQPQAHALQQRLSSIEASGSDALIAAAATVVASTIADRAPRAAASSPAPEVAELERSVTEALRAALAPEGAALQSTAVEVMQVVQALLVFGRCEGFEGLPDGFAARDAPPKWAGALLSGRAAAPVMHSMVGEVAHELGRVCAVAEAAYRDILDALFQPQA